MPCLANGLWFFRADERVEHPPIWQQLIQQHYAPHEGEERSHQFQSRKNRGPQPGICFLPDFATALQGTPREHSRYET
jgi:hypothetical protein